MLLPEFAEACIKHLNGIKMSGISNQSICSIDYLPKKLKNFMHWIIVNLT